MAVPKNTPFCACSGKPPSAPCCDWEGHTAPNGGAAEVVVVQPRRVQLAQRRPSWSSPPATAHARRSARSGSWCSARPSRHPVAGDRAARRRLAAVVGRWPRRRWRIALTTCRDGVGEVDAPEAGPRTVAALGRKEQRLAAKDGGPHRGLQAAPASRPRGGCAPPKARAETRRCTPDSCARSCSCRTSQRG